MIILPNADAISKSAKFLFIFLSPKQSSANMPVLDLTLEGKSFTKARMSSRPSKLPCGTPEVTGEVSDLEPSSTTCCVLPDRKSCIHFSKLPLIGWGITPNQIVLILLMVCAMLGLECF